ncbi:MAG: hypothetical protein U0003_03720 [Vampirovibrionales bacterium]
MTLFAGCCRVNFSGCCKVAFSGGDTPQTQAEHPRLDPKSEQFIPEMASTIDRADRLPRSVLNQMA